MDSVSDIRSKFSISKKEAAKLAHTVSLVLFYYTFAIGLTFYNKWIFKSFHFPLTTSCIHFLVVFLISAALRFLRRKCKKDNPYITWPVYLKNVFVTGLASALDIGLSNWSFVLANIICYI